MTDEKGTKVLISSGIFDAYQSLESILREYGLPSENLFSALMIKERLKARNAQMKQRPIEKERARLVWTSFGIGRSLMANLDDSE